MNPSHSVLRPVMVGRDGGRWNAIMDTVQVVAAIVLLDLSILKNVTLKLVQHGGWEDGQRYYTSLLSFKCELKN